VVLEAVEGVLHAVLHRREDMAGESLIAGYG